MLLRKETGGSHPAETSRLFVCSLADVELELSSSLAPPPVLEWERAWVSA